MVQTLRPASPELSMHSYLSGDADFIELPEPYVEWLLDDVGDQQTVAMGPALRTGSIQCLSGKPRPR